MSFADITADLAGAMPALRGRLTANQPMADLTWFRVGGPAQVLFTPADVEDLAYFLARRPANLPLTVVGVGSNLIVRDGGVPGVVVRLSPRGFGAVTTGSDGRVTAGAAVLDKRLSETAAEAGIAGLEFLVGIPGSVGGALKMNAGAHGGEVRDVFVAAEAVSLTGERQSLDLAGMGFSYRHCAATAGRIFTGIVVQGGSDAPEAIRARMDEILRQRAAAQPVRARTGGSTFKNPPGESAWKLIEAAGCRGLQIGGAQVSEMHCNFLLNVGGATAADIESLGETVRRRVFEACGIDLQWEIERIGVPTDVGGVTSR